MIYKHPDNPRITWEDGKRGRPPGWVIALREKKVVKKTTSKKKVVAPKEESDDPVSTERQVLSGGSFRVNGRVIYVGTDCEFITCPGDRITKIADIT